MRTSIRHVLGAFACTVWLLPTAGLAQVTVVSESGDPARHIFPSDRFTVDDPAQQTLRRVNLPKPDCAAGPARCADIDVLNELDGFNTQPRISIPFSGAIDPASVSSDTLFLVGLGGIEATGSVGRKVGINQIVWDPETNVLHVEPDELLEQHARYAVVVTNGIRGADGAPLAGSVTAGDAPGSALQQAQQHTRHDIVALSVFTTLSTTAVLEKIARRSRTDRPAPADFDIGNDGTVRAVFPLERVRRILAVRQTGTAPAFGDPTPLPLVALELVPDAVAHIAFGKFASPSFLVPDGHIPAVATRTGEPAVQRIEEVYFNLFVPAGAKPASGWPIAIFGHGFGSNKDIAPFVLAAKLAEQGIALVAINVPGHGQGPLGTFTVELSDAEPVTVPAGGRGVDQDGNGEVTAIEGSSAGGPRSLVGTTDALRQAAADLMQLTRQIDTGLDYDGDGSADFDRSRIYYIGQSFGGIYGALFLALEPGARAGVLNVAGGPVIDIARLSPSFRPLFLQQVLARGLSNAPAPVYADENLPLRNRPPVVNDVAGAAALQRLIDDAEWIGQVGSPVAYAPHLRRAPLPGAMPKSVILQFAKGDQTVPNPTSSAVVRAGDLVDRVSYFRNDLAVAASGGTPLNPHTFLTNVVAGGIAPVIALQAQTQIATFLASDGAIVTDPDGDGPFFEVPIAEPLPEELNYLMP